MDIASKISIRSSGYTLTRRSRNQKSWGSVPLPEKLVTAWPTGFRQKNLVDFTQDFRGKGLKQIGDRFGLHYSTVSRIIINQRPDPKSLIAIYELNDTEPLTDLFRASYLRGCEVYNATAEAFGFDEIRIRYRTEGRSIIRDVVRKELVGELMTAHISRRIEELIPGQHHEAFRHDLMEDLTELSPQRIAGLGITLRELQYWLQLKTNNTAN